MNGRKVDIVPCGKCHICLNRRRQQWVFRLLKQAEVSSSMCFLTLTYEREPLSFNGHGTLHKPHLQRFWKRLRKRMPGAKLKYYAVGEYGTKTKRPHYHAIVYNIPQALLLEPKAIQDAWGHGHVDIGSATAASTSYVCGYIMLGTWKPEQDDDDRVGHFSVMSKGLGANYMTPEIVEYHKKNLIGHVTRSGNRLLSMPRYYKDKIFTKGEKIKIAEEMQMLHTMDWQAFANHDFDKEVREIKEGVFLHEKQLKLKEQLL